MARTQSMALSPRCIVTPELGIDNSPALCLGFLFHSTANTNQLLLDLHLGGRQNYCIGTGTASMLY